jgi:hypothetical protein
MKIKENVKPSTPLLKNLPDGAVFKGSVKGEKGVYQILSWNGGNRYLSNLSTGHLDYCQENVVVVTSYHPDATLELGKEAN